ncbi:MAG: aminotransferase class V-fold PLP-dependent enzyme [Leptolyngbya sp. SIO3F4]|nr:aminotransferase class V-fold PLP-dependent enzyme [Leptolyngbya sp. SIO3F4]
MQPDILSELTLDMTPEQFRQLGYKAVDLIAENLEQLQNRLEPARRAVPDDLREQLLNQSLPQVGSDPAELIEFIEQHILPYPLGHINPRFFAWVNSPAAPLSIIGELLSAGMNSSAAGGDQASTYLEHAVLNWLKEIMGLPQDSGALLVSGGSMATLVGLAVMRHCKTQTGNIRGQGLQQEPAPMVVYKSVEGHSCLDKAVELLGIGRNYLRPIPVDDEFRMDVTQLRQQIKEDRHAGLHPVCVVANAGTVNTGAIDPFDQIADICQQENLWLHVDGAFGGVGILADKVKHLYKGIERADSLGIDPHKWMYIPVECGCAIVQNQQAMRDTFSVVPPYLRDDRQLPWFSEYGPQQTRAFRALKLWLAMKHIGLEGYRQLITRDIDLAKLLQEKILACSDFELMATGPLSVTCFRYAPLGAHDLKLLNRAILDIVQSQGQVYLTSTEVKGEFVLRANIINFRTNEADLDFLLHTLAQAGQQVLESKTYLSGK